MAIDGGSILTYLELDISDYQKAMEKAIELMQKAGKEDLQAGERMNNLGAGIQAMGQQLITGGDALAEMALKLGDVNGVGQQAAAIMSDIAGAIGPLMNVGGTLVRALSGPAGWVALLTGAGVAGVVALNNMHQAAIQADLEGRFGSITLSAQEMDEVMEQLLGRNAAYEELMDAGNALQAAKEQLSASAETMDKLWIKTQMGYEVDPEELTRAAEQLARDVSDVIEAQQVKASLNVDALFGANDPQGEKIKGDFNAYFSQLDAEATGVGLELAQLINDALVDGIMDADEQAAIQAQYEKLNAIKTGVVNMEARGAQLRFDLASQNTELTPETISGLLESGNALMQANMDAVNQQYEDIYNLATNIAAVEGRGADDPKLQADIAAAQQARDEQLATVMADNALSLWNAVGSRVAAGYTEEMQAAQDVADRAYQRASEAAKIAMQGKAETLGTDEYAQQYQEWMASYLPEAFVWEGWGEIMEVPAMEGLQKLYYGSLEPMHDALRHLAQEQGEALAPELRDALGQLNLLEMLAADLPMQAGSSYAENMAGQMLEEGREIGVAAADGMRAGVQEGIREEAGQQNALQGWDVNALAGAWADARGRVSGLTGAVDGRPGSALSTAMRAALSDAYAQLENVGINPTQDSLSLGDKLRDTLREQLQAVGWDGIVTPQMRQEAQAMYADLAPMHETLQAVAQTMGDSMPEALQSALGQLNLLQLMSLDETNLAETLAGQMTAGTDAAQSAGQELADSAVAGLDTAQAGAAEAGSNAGAGFIQGAGGYAGQAYQMGYAMAQSYVRGTQRGLDAHSPSRETARMGRFAVEGFAGEVRKGSQDAYGAGYAMARAALTGVAEGQDSHSPSRLMAALGADGAAGYVVGFAETAQANRQTLKDIIKGNAAAQKEQEEQDKKDAQARAASAAAARARAEAAAEAARQQAVLDGINQTAAATLAADTAAFRQRMDALNGQYQSLMDFAGGHAIWYQDDKGETAVAEAKARYDALIAEEKARYEKQTAALATDEQKKAAKKAYDDRVALLKEQRGEETEALKKQYDLQKEMASDWLSYQKSLLSAELSAKRAAYEEDDYQDELAELQKKQRQSKSAREKRELQEQIDRMIRDHAMEMEENALQETLAGYDALIDAVNKGLIGLGDLTGNDAFGDLSFGTAGLSALDNLTAQQLQNVLASLERSALSEGVGATVSAAQMASALQSATGAAAVPVVVTQEGRNYTIDLRGAIVRDDSDIDRIMEELDRRLRAAGR